MEQVDFENEDEFDLSNMSEKCKSRTSDNVLGKQYNYSVFGPKP